MSLVVQVVDRGPDAPGRAGSPITRGGEIDPTTICGEKVRGPGVDLAYRVTLPQTTNRVEFYGANGSYLPVMAENVCIDSGCDAIAIPFEFWHDSLTLFNQYKETTRTAGALCKVKAGICRMKIRDDSEHPPKYVWPIGGDEGWVRVYLLPETGRTLGFWNRKRNENQNKPPVLIGLNPFGNSRLCLHLMDHASSRGWFFGPESKDCFGHNAR